MKPETVLKLVERIDDLPTIPAIALEVNRLLSDQEVSTSEICQLIRQDQAMVPRILKLVNSSFFGLRSKVINIERAAVLLGNRTLQNAIMSIAVIDSISFEPEVKAFNLADFWTHAIEVATISKHLACETRLVQPEDAFTAGLLHDLGKIILVQYFPDFFEKIRIEIIESEKSFYFAEKSIIGVTHCQMGKILGEKWQLPSRLTEVIRYHHEVDFLTESKPLLLVVHIADMISNRCSLTTGCNIDPNEVPLAAVTLLSREIETVNEWYIDLAEQVRSGCNFFNKE